MFLEHSVLEFLRQFFYVYFKSVPSAHEESDNVRYIMLKEWNMSRLPFYDQASWSETDLMAFTQSVQTGAPHKDVFADSEAEIDSEFEVGADIGDVFQTSQKTRPKLMRDLWRYHRDEQQGNEPQNYRHKDIMCMLTSEILRSANTVRRNNELCIHYAEYTLEHIVEGPQSRVLQGHITTTLYYNTVLNNLIKGVKMMAFFVKVFVREQIIGVNGIEELRVLQVDPAYESIMKDVKYVFYNLVGINDMNAHTYRGTYLTFPLSFVFDSPDKTIIPSGILSVLTRHVQDLLIEKGKFKREYFCSQSYMKFWWNKLKQMKRLFPEYTADIQTDIPIQVMYRCANMYYARYNKSANEWMARTNQGRTARHRGGGKGAAGRTGSKVTVSDTVATTRVTATQRDVAKTIIREGAAGEETADKMAL